MTFTEKELEDILYEKLKNREFESLYQKGFDLYHPNDDIDIMFVDRQVDLNPYGIADIIITTIDLYTDPVGLNGNVIIDLIELKANTIKSKDINQVLRYKTAIERYATKKFESNESKYCYEVNVRPILIGNGIESGHYILNELSDNDITLYTYEFNPIDGIEFKYEGLGWYVDGDHENDFIERLDKSLMYNDCCDYFEKEHIVYLNKLQGGENE